MEKSAGIVVKSLVALLCWNMKCRNRHRNDFNAAAGGLKSFRRMASPQKCSRMSVARAASGDANKTTSDIVN